MTIISAHHHQHYRKWPPPTHFRCSNYILDPFKWKTKSRINAVIRALKNDFSFQLPNGISSKESALPEYYTHTLITTLSPPLGHHQSNSNTLMAHQVLIYYDSHQTTNVPDGFDQIFRAHTSELFNLETSINRFCRPAMIVLMAHPKMEWRLQHSSPELWWICVDVSSRHHLCQNVCYAMKDGLNFTKGNKPWWHDWAFLYQIRSLIVIQWYLQLAK